MNRASMVLPIYRMQPRALLHRWRMGWDNGQSDNSEAKTCLGLASNWIGNHLKILRIPHMGNNDTVKVRSRKSPVIDKELRRTQE